MAVQKSRVSPSRRGQRRAHDSLTAKQLSTDPTSVETPLRHHVTADGYYPGKPAIVPKARVVEADRPSPAPPPAAGRAHDRTSVRQSLLSSSYAVFLLLTKNHYEKQ